MYYNISYNSVFSNNTEIYPIDLCCMLIVLMVIYSLSIQYNIIYSVTNDTHYKDDRSILEKIL